MCRLICRVIISPKPYVIITGFSQGMWSFTFTVPGSSDVAMISMDYSLKATDLDAIPRHYWYKCLFLEHPSLCFNVKPTKYDELKWTGMNTQFWTCSNHLFETLNLCTSADFLSLKGRCVPMLQICQDGDVWTLCHWPHVVRYAARQESSHWCLWSLDQAPGVLVAGWWYNLHVSFLLAESENAGRW